MKPAAMKEGKLYSQQPHSGAGDFTFSRANGVQTRINEHGLIETVADNTPRLSYDLDADGNVSECPTLLLEPTSTNLLQRSEDYANSYWLKARVGSSATGYTAPDGTNNATYYEQASGQTTAAVIYKSSFTSASSGIYTFSVWAKKAEKRYFKFQTRVNSSTYRTVFDLQEGVITYDSGNENAKIEEYPNGWYRLSVQRTSTTTNDIIVYYYLNDSAGADDTVTDSGGVYIWGSQVEKSNYPTSYIPTEGSTEVRNADSPALGNSQEIIGQTEGVLFFDFENYGQVGTSYINHVKIESEGNNDRVAIQSDAAALNRIILVINNGSSTFFQPIEDISLGRNKIAIKYKSGYINGVKEQASTTSFSFANTLNNIYLGSNSQVNELSLFNEALSDSELITLTT